MKRLHIGRIVLYELTDARRIIHRLMLQRGKAVVEHRARHVQTPILILRFMQLVFCHLHVVGLGCCTPHTLLERLLYLVNYIAQLGIQSMKSHSPLVPRLPNALQLHLVGSVTQQDAVDFIHLLHGETEGQYMAIIEQIVSQRQLQQKEDEQHDGHRLRVLRQLHGAHIGWQRRVSSHLAVELGVDLVIAAIEVPLV